MKAVRLLWAVLALPAWVAVSAAGLSGDTALQRRFADGLMLRGLHEHAIREYLIFQEQNPDYENMDVIDFRIAESYRRLANLAAAVRAYNRVIERDPPSAYRHRAVLRRAEMHRLAGRPGSAAEQLRVLLQERPEPEIADATHYWLGRSLAAAGEREAAAAVWRDYMNSGRESAFTPYMALELGRMLAGGSSEDSREALQWLQRVAGDPPDDRHGAEALFQLALLAVETGDDQQAAVWFDEFAKRYPDDQRLPESRLPAAWAYFRLGRHADSLLLCAAVLDSEADRPEFSGPPDQWLYLRANNQRRLERHAVAVAGYERLLQEHPDSPLFSAAVLEKSQSQYLLGDYRTALESVQAAPVTADNRLQVLWLKAAAHEAGGDEDPAIQNYRLLLEQYPDSDQAYEGSYRLARLLQKRGDAWPAAEAFQGVASRYPDRPLAPVSLMAAAELLRSLDRHAEAVRDYTRLLKEYSEHTLAEQALYRKAVGEAYLGRNEAAIRSLRELVQRFPKSDRKTDAVYTMGLLHLRESDFAEAEAAFARALQLRPEPELHHQILFRRGFALRKLQRDNEAAELYKQLLEVPDIAGFDPALLEWLSRSLRDEQNPEAALQAADQLAASATGNPEWLQTAHTLAGLAALDAADTQSARRRFESALEQEAVTPYAAEAAIHLAELLLTSGEPASARHRFRQAEQYARDEQLSVLRARALFGLGVCHEAENNLDDANRYYALVGLTYNVPVWSERALRKAAEIFERLNSLDERDKMLQELQQRYGVSDP